ncbi:YfcC family protein [Sporosarcina sp. ANT_H38]|uniref:YfcC family protein n=1 Tax=Sporosarcina sp. ANT_H38 TaxID=2597358 RepID=UPI0011F0C849|nr:AbgT family transporter [Sporosarcina sp. ANT_H38]KAA0941655.1 YfcC family protein [Sporosarcina sp. ANT_H38]
MSKKEKRKGFNFPHVYIMFLLVMLLVIVLSWIVPSGQYERNVNPETGITELNTEVFEYVDQAKPIGFMDFFTALHNGVVQSADIIVMLLFASGALYILEKSGAITAGIHKLLRVAGGKEKLIIIVLLTLFSVMGTIGFGEGGIPFIPLAMAVVMGMGYDRITAFATSTVGLAIGFTAGAVNFYTTGVSQSIVGLPIYSGLVFRIVALVIFIVISMVYILRYANKTKANPMKSIVAEEYIEQLENTKKAEYVEEEFTLPRKIALLGLVAVLVGGAYGAIQLGWGMPQLSAVYAIYAVFLVIMLRLDPSEAAVTFGTGAARLLPTALAIGFARSVMILMDQAQIIDPAVHALSGLLSNTGSVITLLVLFLVVIFFNFFVVSGSGKAMILMPIMGPLGKILGINQQVMVVVYQFGDGFTNYLWPTSGGLMAALGMANVNYADWVKFSLKLFMLLHFAAFVLIIVAHYIGLGPA